MVRITYSAHEPQFNKWQRQRSRKYYLHKLSNGTKSKQEEFAAVSPPRRGRNKEEREELQAQIKQYTAMEAQLLTDGFEVRSSSKEDIYRARDRSKAAQKIFQDIEKMAR